MSKLERGAYASFGEWCIYFISSGFFCWRRHQKKQQSAKIAPSPETTEPKAMNEVPSAATAKIHNKITRPQHVSVKGGPLIVRAQRCQQSSASQHAAGSMRDDQEDRLGRLVYFSGRY
eukprot:2214416-Amphidinium_carterae.1